MQAALKSFADRGYAATWSRQIVDQCEIHEAALVIATG